MTAPIPWPPEPHLDDPELDGDVDRLYVFVPAIMSVGLVFSLATLLRDVFHWTGDRARRRRTEIEAGAVVSDLLDEGEPDPAAIGMLSRPTYLITALVLVTGAAYVAIGSTANFVRDGGYVRDIGWLLAISLGLALVLGFLGGVSLAVFRSWPHPPPWAYGPLRAAPLSSTPGQAGVGPSWALSATTLAAGVATGIVTLLVGSGRSVALDIDRPIARWLVEAEWIERLSPIDPFGGTAISIGFVVLIGLSGFRCRVMAVVYPVAFLVSWLGGAAIREIVERPRPTGFGDFESYPSGHLVQAVFIAGLVPLALGVLLSDRRAAVVSRALLSLAVVATALHRLHNQDHWPLDVLGGILLGLTVVLASHWLLEHRVWHQGCDTCPWSAHPAVTPWGRGVLAFDPPTIRWIGRAGAVGALLAAGGLAVLTVTVGLPTDPEGYGFGSTVSGPMQLGLAGVMGMAGLLALRWRAPAAVLMAFAAAGLGLFASVEYRPLVAVTLTGLLLIPAVITWLAWQPEETLGRIAGLAAITVTLLTVTATGSRTVYAHYFGPTHPDSTADGLDGEADWLWLGAVGPETATVTAGRFDDDEEIHLRYWPTDRPEEVEVVSVRPDDQDVARFVLAPLEPASEYRYELVTGDPTVPADDDDDEDEDDDDDDDRRPGRGDSGFSTFDDGPQDLVVTVGSCARTGSNGAVYDAMVAEGPDLYLAIGDLHYSNLESTDPADHIGAYRRSLSQPGQSQIFGAIPTAYVWDDHDYGPNDADSASVSRQAVSLAYRAAVPHYGVDPDPDQPINQAFTVGRIRFVVADTRSHRTDDSMLGPDQQAWLIDELVTSSQTHPVVIWVNPTPWIGPATVGSDDWSAYPDDRRAIADALSAAEVDNLVMVSGDAHMVAIDDGTNSGYATDGGGGFPVLHAAALDRPGSVKGGPYSHGTYPGGGQYGRIRISDDGGPTIRVELSGRTWQDETLVELELEFEASTDRR